MRRVTWVGSSLDDLRSFPRDVQDTVGYALYLAQMGGKHPSAKPLRGFGGAGVLEVTEDYAGDTFRAVYTLTLPEAVYVLHAFQKQAKHGIATPKRELDLIRQRLRQAQEMSEQLLREQK
jgi:phage-related protein